MKRVVITGVGAVSPIGNTPEEILHALKTGYCGIGEIQSYDIEGREVALAAHVKDYDPLEHFAKKDLRRLDRVNQLAIVAGRRAVKDGLLTDETVDKRKVGVYVSSGIGGLSTIETEHSRGLEKGFDKVSPFFIPMSISNMSASAISMEHGFHGNCLCTVTACAGSASAIGEAFRAIKHGYASLILAGGSEASITTLGVGGFTSMKALTTETDPLRGSIPFDKDRSGFVMGEGSAVIVLEELEHAKKRNAKIYGEIIGYGATCDAYHITSPCEDGEFAALAMEMAVEEGGIEKTQVEYINAHGTSTPLNDKYETVAIKKCFGDHAQKLAVSSSKSMTGHLLGAAGAFEAIVTLFALKEGFLPPTINFRQADEDCDLDVVPNVARNSAIQYAISNSLGFGGHNVSLLFKKWEEE